MRAILDSEIRIPLEDLSEPVMAGLGPLISIPNKEKDLARKTKRYGWTEMPDEIQLWDRDDSYLYLPRGLRDPLSEGCEALGDPIEWDDRRTRCTDFRVWPPFERYRPFQQPAARRVLEAEDGIVEAPAGSGKSVTGLEVIRIARQARNIVVVNTINIATQWIDEARDFLGEDFGYGVIGEGRWEESRLTVATVQTLYSRREELDRDGWWEKWGLSCLDECHHQTARTFIEVFGRFQSWLRFGLSATPDKTGDFEFAQAVLGDVIHRTTRHELRDYGILMRPTIRVVDTDFRADYWPDHQATLKEKFVCQKPGCKLSGKRRHGHRNNYTSVLKELVADRHRNALVAKKALSRSGRRQLVVSPQTGHLNNVRVELERAGFADPVYFLTGSEDDERRQEVIRLIRRDPGLVLSTVADEALNVPPLDTLHMPFPTKNTGSVRQRIGRIERAMEGKEDAVAFDYRDRHMGVYMNQYRERRWGVYAPEMYTVVSEDEGE